MRSAAKVFVVEDEAIISLEIQSHLTHFGFEISGTARSAAEAFAAIDANPPDIVLMDIRIDGELDGIAAAAIIRSRYDLPVIYLTAHADEATLRRAEATEPFGYIVKPMQDFKVRAVITMALRRHRAERELEQSRTLLASALKELAEAKQLAEAASRAKSDFLARMSHEIRTPMNLIMGMNSLLLESPLNEKQKQHVEISLRNVRRLLRLINGILDLSKVEAGELTFESTPFDLDEVLSECSATLDAALERKRLRLTISRDPVAGRFWRGDAERLHQVLLNVIGNSIKFTSEGSIDARICPEQGPQGEQGLRFTVTDDGCGIPPEKSAVIFEAFQQVDVSSCRSFEGTGLGLAIAKTLVERMGGRIWMDESYRSGARFVFTAFLPPATESEVKRKVTGASAQAVPAIGPGTRILLVEDNDENVALVQAYLENLSLTIDVAENGVEGVLKRQSKEYDLVLMDIQMPLMDGHQATREIRRWEKSTGACRVPIVAVTAHALSNSAAQSIDAGCDAHLTKPLERADLIDAIAKFTRSTSAPRPDSLPNSILSRQPAFLANRWLDIEKLRTALAGQNFPTIQKIGHDCKGIGTGYGFPQISKLGALIEQAAKAQDVARSETAIGDFESFLQTALDQTT